MAALGPGGVPGGFRNTTCQDRYGPYGTNAPGASRPTGTARWARSPRPAPSGLSPTPPPSSGASTPSSPPICLEAARRGESYLRAHPAEASDGPSCPAYRADGNRRWAGTPHVRRGGAPAGHVRAPRSREDFERSYVELDYDPSYHHFNGFAAQLYLRAAAGDPARKRHPSSDSVSTPTGPGPTAASRSGGRPATHWGSIGAAFVRTDAYSIQLCLADRVRFAADCEQALANVHYVLGRNYLHFCYVSGLPGVSHGRQWAFHHWLATLRAEPHDFPGMVAGGPNAAPEPTDGSKPWARPIPIWGYWGDPAFPRDATTPFEARFTDNDSWSTNEISLDWQAAALYGFQFARWMARTAPEPPRGAADPRQAGQ